jgi:NAD(P)-dependent dehydrogenase (short-subunit alcohol dehydrogenase family)
MSFKDRVYTVTGAASGIGLALTLKLVEAGAVVYASDVNGEGLAKTVEQCMSLRPYAEGASIGW